jgi:demethylmenaquinone methyltransferase / 2-methoxy-6-polyprenyl-1,4-benzoquinol methylase
MAAEVTGRIKQAQAIFSAIADDYERPAQLFGLCRYRYWQRELAALVAERKPTRVLDMCTGTGAIAAEIAARCSTRIVAADVTFGMLTRARRNPVLLGGAGTLFVQAAAQAPPFADGVFDVVVFSYLLRYVDDVPGTIAALGRLVKPGGLMVSLEFGVPQNPILHALWTFYTRVLMPAGLSLLSPGWRRVGGFLGRSIVDFYRRHSPSALEGYFEGAGFKVHPTRRLSGGGGIIMSGTKQLAGASHD